jgi:hypothetical protein
MTQNDSQKPLPPVEYSMKYISWHQKDIVAKLGEISASLQDLNNIVREMVGKQAVQRPQPAPKFGQDIPF